MTVRSDAPDDDDVVPLPRAGAAVWFALRLACLLSLCMYPWPRVGEVYSDAAGALGNLLLGDAASTLHFVRAESGSGFSIELVARRSMSADVVRVPIDLRTLTYIPTAVFLALTLAARIWTSSRGVTVLVLGLVWLHGFLIASITIPLLLFFAEPQPMHLLDLGTTLRQLLDIVYRSLVAPPGMTYAVPALIWLALLWLVPDARGEHHAL